MEADFAWCAGLFDGEGSTSVLKTQRDRYSYIRMNIPQKYREVLDKFLNIIKVGKIYQHKTREIFSLNIYKQSDVIYTLNILWPYLSEIKKKQAIKACEYVDKYSKVF